jgi:outer membrane protein assembly factor BamB
MGHNTVWQYDSHGKRDVSARRPVLRGAALYIVQSYRHGAGVESALIRFDADTGEPRWEFRIPCMANQPVIGPDGVVYLSAFDGALYAVGPEGRQRWRTAVTNRNLGAPCLLDNGHLVVPEVGTGATRTYGVDRRDGARVWQVDGGGHVYGLARAGSRFVQTVISAMNFGVLLQCVDVVEVEDRVEPDPTHKAKIAWVQQHDEYAYRPLIAGDHVYVGARHSVRVHDLASGALLGQFGLSGGASVTGELLHEAGYLYFGDSKGVLRALNVREPTSPALVWDYLADAPITAQPVLFDDELFFITHSGALHGLNPETGRERSKLALKTEDDIGGLCATGTALFAAHGRGIGCFGALALTPTADGRPQTAVRA